MSRPLPLMHPSWLELLARLRKVGVLEDATAKWAGSALGQAATQPVSPSAAAELLHAFHLADGDWPEALWRRQRNGFVEVRGEVDPGSVLEQITHALPHLAPWRAARGRTAFVIEAMGERVALSRVSRHARLERHTRRVPDERTDAILKGVNVLLARRDHDARFIELNGTHGRRAFVCVEPEVARVLSQLALTPYDDRTALRRFASWDTLPAGRRATG
ncbi:MAG: hypothetical protein VYE22_29565 [Myxococcota bacterium]|nr:hypothetical protein [Myxococcota bacterium]